MSRKIKALEMAALTGRFQGVRNMLFLAPYRINSAEEFDMRKSLRGKNVRLQLVKNAYARKVLKEQGIAVKDDVFSGPLLLAWGPESVKDLSKAVEEVMDGFKKKNPKAETPKLGVKTAVAEGEVVTFEAALKMPTRLEAIGEIIGAALGPASELAAMLTGPAATVASQIVTISERKEDGGDAPPAA